MSTFRTHVTTIFCQQIDVKRDIGICKLVQCQDACLNPGACLNPVNAQHQTLMVFFSQHYGATMLRQELSNAIFYQLTRDIFGYRQ